ncbi:MAG: TolC family protein [Salinisphaera sp.]|nr:TolC family protein [Salinisphaera sp.]
MPQGPDLALSPALTVPAQALAIPGLRAHPFDAANGLDMTEVVTLAVLNNPDLKAKRLQARVAGAQLLQAGLLPNPQLSADFIHPTGGPPPLFNGDSFGLAQDLTALVARGAAKASAKNHQKQVDLEILWQEWQVAQQARQLYIKVRAETRLHHVLQKQHQINAENYRRDRAALRRSDLTLATVSTDLVGLVDADTQSRQLERDRNSTWHALDALLGLQPGTTPRLTGTIKHTPMTRAQFRAAIARLPQRRPDLLALQAGYQSQQQAVREAILKQFPALSVGVTQGSDTQAVHTIGFGVTLSLPLFNHNQGQIAVARATRAVLRETYQARLDQAVNQAHKLWQAVDILHRQLQQLHARLSTLQQTTDAAQRSFAAGNMSAGTYISLRSSLLAKQVEAIRLKATLQQTQAALETLLGMTLDKS